MKIRKIFIMLGLISLNTIALAHPGFDMTVGFVNLTNDVITITQSSASYCITDVEGIFTGGSTASVVLNPGDFSYSTTTNKQPNRISAKTGGSIYAVGCNNDPHRSTLKIQYGPQSWQYFLANIYIPTTHSNGTRGVLSFNDQQKADTELNFMKSIQEQNPTIISPYNMQIQASNSALAPIIYIYPKSQSVTS